MFKQKRRSISCLEMQPINPIHNNRYSIYEEGETRKSQNLTHIQFEKSNNRMMQNSILNDKNHQSVFSDQFQVMAKLNEFRSKLKSQANQRSRPQNKNLDNFLTDNIRDQQIIRNKDQSQILKNNEQLIKNYGSSIISENENKSTILTINEDQTKQTEAETFLEKQSQILQLKGSKLILNQKKYDIPLNEMIYSTNRLKYVVENPKIGMKNYELKSNMHIEPFFKVQSIALRKSLKQDHFIDQYINQNKWKQSAQYNLIDFVKNIPKTGKWSKCPRITFTESVILENKRRPKPAPNHYPQTRQLADNIKQKAVSGSRSEKICGFIEECGWKSNQTPAPGGDKKLKIQYTQIDLSLKTPKIWKENESSQFKRFEKIQKDKTKPAPGDYNVLEAFNSTQQKSPEYALSTTKLKNFTDIYKEQKKFVPDCGAYKYTMNVFKQLSISPVALRIKRH